MRADHVPPTSFVRRRRELADLRRLLNSTRLLTLAGTGGSGKTRLANELAHRTRTGFIAWVDLASLRDPAEVAPAVERALGITADGRLTTEAVASALRGARGLLVLDNCEHLLPAHAEVAARVLAASDDGHVLATSRAPLRVSQELVWRVPSLSLPDTVRGNGMGLGLRAHAIRLFFERARLAHTDFRLDERTYPLVAEI